MADTNEQLALSWVRKEINKSLEQARHGLEAFAENDSDVTQIRFCISCLHQVRGTLQMLEFFGAALFAEEMEHLADAIANGKYTAKEKALEVLMQSMLQLPTYLDRVQEGRKDLPVVLLPLLNELRASRGAHPISESAIFTPEVSNVEPPQAEQEKKDVDPDSFIEIAKKFRVHYQKGLLGVMRNQNVKEGIQRMHKVLEKLEDVTSGHPVSRLWWIADGFLFSIIERGLFKDPAVHALLGKVDRYIKRLSDLGVDALNDTIPDDLLQNLLYYVAKAESKHKKVIKLKEEFDLLESLPSEEQVETERRAMQGPDAGAIETVVGAINEDLINVKDTLDLFVRSSDKSHTKLKGLLPDLQRISDTLGVLGLGIPRDVVKQQIATLQKVVDNNSPISDAIVMDVAGALLFVEANIANVKPADVGQDQETTAEELEEKREHAASAAQFDEAKLQLLKASRSNLQKAKEQIIDFIASSFDASLIGEVPVLLTEIQGGLQIVGFEGASELLDKAQQFVERKLLAAGQKPEEDVMDALADIITSVEYCLDNYNEIGSSAFDSILNAARHSQDILEVELAKDDGPVEPLLPEADEVTVETVAETQPEPTPVEPVITEPTPTPEPAIEAVEANKAPDESLIDEEVLEIFLEEAEEELAQINELLPQWSNNPDDEETLTTIRRSFHTLKGSGRLVGASLAGELAWSIENMLNRVLDGTIKAHQQIFDLLKSVCQLMPELIDAFSKNQLPTNSPDQLMAKAHAIAKGEAYAEPEVAEPTPDEVLSDDADLVAELQAEDVAAAEAVDDVPMVEEQPVALEGELLEPEEADDLLVPELEVPELSEELEVPELEVPELDVPELEVPELENAELDVPELAVPELEVPELEDTEFETVLEPEVPELEAPELEVPDLEVPELEVSELEAPALEDFAGSDLPELEAVESEDDLVEFEPLAEDLDLAAEDISDESLEIPELPVDDAITLDEVAAAPTEPDLVVSEAEELEPVGLDDVLEISESLDEPAIDEASAESVEQPAVSELDVDPVLLDIFVTEADSHLQAIRDYSNTLKTQPNARPSDELLRAMHTLKGSAYMAEMNEIAELAGPLEALVREYRQRDTNIQSGFVDALAQTEHYLANCMDALRAHRQCDHSAQAGLVAEVSKQLAELKSGGPEPEETPELNLKGDPELLGIFLTEGLDIVSEARALLEQWQQDQLPQVPDSLLAEMNTLKRGADMALLESAAQVAQSMEAFFSRSKQRATDDTYFVLAGEALDFLKQTLNAIEADHPLPDASAMVEQLSNWQPSATSSAEKLVDIPQPELPREEISETILPEDVTQAVDEVDEELLEFFLEEADELVEEIESNLESWRSDLNNLLSVANLQRNLHTLKGSARMAGVMNAGNLAHSLEDLYEKLGGGEFVAQGYHIDLSFKVLDHVRSIIEQLRDHADYSFDKSLLAEVQNSLSGNVPEQLTRPQQPAATAPTKAAETITQKIELDADGEEVLDIYLEEAEEIVESLDGTLQAWSADPSDSKAIETLQRHLHTLKGGARLSDLNALGDLTHEMESYFEKVAAGLVQVGRPQVDFVMQGYDLIQGLVDQVKNQRLMTVPTEYMAQLQRLLDGETPAAVPAAKPAVKAKPVESNVVPFEAKAVDAEMAEAAEPKQRSKQQEVVRIGAEQLENLVNLSGETSIFRARLEQQISVLRYNLDEMDGALDRLREQLRNLEIETDAQIEYRREIAGVDYEEFDPLEFDRYTRQQELTRSLGESSADLSSLKESLDNLASDSETLLLQQGRVNSEMQERLMRTRMVPFDSLVPRLRRIVRQIGNELGKAVDLSISAEGEMDRTVLERMIAPIEHMLRNAMDHGIESPDERKQAGKADTGRVRIRLYREGSEIFIEIQDDGRGLDINAIRNKAIERELINEHSELSDHELQQLIFEAGFSTAQKVTQISGRGVGMDVVSSEIKQLGGVVEINSERGKGATFTVKLPFTVSVNQALMIQVGDDIYAVPLTNIEGIVRVSPFEIQEYYDNEQARFDYAGMQYHMRYMGNLLDHNVKPNLEGVTKALPILLLHGAEYPTAVQVDELLGSREIVVKSVGTQLSLLSGLSGATILGDGRVVLILDVPALTRRADAILADDTLVEEVRYDDRIPSVMVVDDSITVRKVTQRLLERHDYEVFTAKDGVDALNVLGDKKPDVMLLDIEMPRMDGFELANIIRHDAQLKDIPIIMITSRTGEKHRERAEGIGVNHYMGKPYNEVDLLRTIETLVPGKN